MPLKKAHSKGALGSAPRRLGTPGTQGCAPPQEAAWCPSLFSHTDTAA